MPPLKEARSATWYYDFAIDGGAVSTILLRGPKLPIGAVILDAFVTADALLTSGGAATVSIGSQAAADLQAAVAFNAVPFTVVGSVRRTSAQTGAPVGPLPKIATTAKPVSIAIATAALTAGKFRVTVKYLKS